MNPIKTGEILPGVYAVSAMQANFYIVKSGRGYIAFDAGRSIKASLKEIKKLQIDPDEVSAVFMTHTDSDHIGGLDAFQNASVFISKPEEQMIDGSTKRALLLGYNYISRPYETLEDGETRAIDDMSVECIVTPGHTKGSACYLVNGKYLFSGDNFGLKKNKIVPFIPLINMDNNEHKRSIEKLSKIANIEAKFTGHHGYLLYANEVK